MLLQLLRLLVPPGTLQEEAVDVDAVLDTGTVIGDLWMWLQLMWLQFQVVRSPVGVAG